MRIGVISDTHIPDRAEEIPDEILEAFKSCDMVLHAGDLVDLSVLEKLKSVCPEVRAVWGNMDPQEVRQKLTEKIIFKAGRFKIALTHGYGSPSKLIDLLSEVFKNEGVDIIVFGHSHYSVNEKRGVVLFFNPGSATDKIFAPFNSYGIIEINDKIEAKIVRI
jgi:uncharacterized protein